MDYFEEQDGEAVNPSTEPTIGEVISRRTFLKGMCDRRFRPVRLRHDRNRERCAQFHGSAAFHKRPAPGSARIQRAGAPAPGRSDPGAPEYNRSRRRRSSGAAVRHRRRLHLLYAAAYGSNSTRGLLGVNHENHRAEPVLPRQSEAAHPRAGRGADGGAGLLDRRDREEASGGVWCATALQPTDLDERADAHFRPGCRTSAHADERRSLRHALLRHVQQLRRRHHPWGTMLTAEENIQNYFSGDAGKGPEAAARKYNISGKGRYADWGRLRSASTSTRNRTSRTASAGSSRSIRTIRTTPR